MEMHIERLNWDSNFFNKEIGKLHLDSLAGISIPTIQERKKEHAFDLLYLFVGKLNESEIDELELAGAKLVDEKVTYWRKISELVDKVMSFESYTGEVTPALLKLALASGHKSRFMKDSRTNHRFRELYSKWIENSVKRAVADEVYITKHEGQLSGFVTLKKSGIIGSIGLIAVAEKMQGKGIGKGLISAANNWYVNNHCQEAIVVTQKDNRQACALYEKSGYTVCKSEFIFHL